MKKLLIILLALGLGQGISNAQQEGPGPNSDPVVDYDVPEEIQIVRGELEALKTELKTSRDALLDELEANNATREEKIVALAEWREANAGTIAQVQELAEQLKALVDEYRPDRIEIPEWVQAKRDELRTLRQQLAESRRAAILALEDPTEEEIRAAIEAWRAENGDLIAQTRALAEEIRTWFQENRPHRPPPGGDMEGMTMRRKQFRQNIHEMRQLREQLMDPNLSEEEYDRIREQQRQLLQERKELMRQKRIHEGDAGGDRRPEG
jgi:chromosome segregation ATPase